MELFLGEALVILRVQREIQDLVPARHGALVRIGRLENAVLLVILNLDLDVSFHLWSVIQLVLRLRGPVSTIVLKRVLPIIVGITALISWAIDSWPVDSVPSSALVRVSIVVF